MNRQKTISAKRALQLETRIVIKAPLLPLISLGISFILLRLFDVLLILVALDLILSRPSDPAYLEYSGITKQAYIFLIEAILTPQAAALYVLMLRKFLFPLGWPRLQSPYYIGSYGLLEYARQSVIIPITFRLQLNNSYIYKFFIKGIQKVKPLADVLIQTNISKVYSIVVFAFAVIARLNVLVISIKITATKRTSIQINIIVARSILQNLLKAVVLGVEENQRVFIRPPLYRRSSQTLGSGTSNISRALSLSRSARPSASRLSTRIPALSPVIETIKTSNKATQAITPAIQTIKY